MYRNNLIINKLYNGHKGPLDPINKLDLLLFSDRVGRAKAPYISTARKDVKTSVYSLKHNQSLLQQRFSTAEKVHNNMVCDIAICISIRTWAFFF